METDASKCDKCIKFKRRILVTGGAGFIGSHVVILLVTRYPDYFVVNLDKLDYCASLRHLDCIKGKPNYKFIQGDICEPDFMRYIFQEECIDVVLHFAAQTHVDVSFWSSLDFTRTNVYGTHVLINAAYEAGVGLFIHVSTDEVYGGKDSAAKAHTEDGKMHPTNPYSASKAAAECIVLSYYEAFNFPVIITRSNNIYGPGQYPEKVIPKFIARLLRNKTCCLHGKGEAVRNFLHVSDLSEAFDVVLHRGSAGQIYNVGAADALSMHSLAKLLVTKVKDVSSSDPSAIEKHLEYVEDRPFNDLRYTMDSSKLHTLGWQPKINWDDGINQTIEWYRSPENFDSWPSSEAALLPYPPGSNTMRVGPYRRPSSTGANDKNVCPKKRTRREDGDGKW